MIIYIEKESSTVLPEGPPSVLLRSSLNLYFHLFLNFESSQLGYCEIPHTTRFKKSLNTVCVKHDIARDIPFKMAPSSLDMILDIVGCHL